MLFSWFNDKHGSRFRYDKSLIKEYKKDHQKLVKILAKVRSETKPESIKKNLDIFKVEILGHLLSEDVRLYKYLKDYYKNDEDTLSLILEYEKSIKEIQKVVINFLDTYTSKSVKFDDIFKTELEGIISALLARVETEEKTLYSLYKK